MQDKQLTGDQQFGESRGLYKENFTRENRGLLVFLLDQSGSMNEPVKIGGYESTKAKLAAAVLNSLLVTIISSAPLDTSTGRRKNYCDIIVFGYGDKVRPLLNSTYSPVPVPDLAENPRGRHIVRVSKFDPSKGSYVEVKEDRPYWIESVADSQRTEMALAISTTYHAVQDWLSADMRRSKSFPPLVFNITDGGHNGVSGNDPVHEAMMLRKLSTNDGEVLLFNCHITSSTDQTLSFPNNLIQINNLHGEERRTAEQLFEMSSIIPTTMATRAQQLSGKRLSHRARGFMYNANGEDLINFLSWGTRIDKEISL